MECTKDPSRTFELDIPSAAVSGLAVFLFMLMFLQLGLQTQKMLLSPSTYKEISNYNTNTNEDKSVKQLEKIQTELQELLNGKQ